MASAPLFSSGSLNPLGSRRGVCVWVGVRMVRWGGESLPVMLSAIFVYTKFNYKKLADSSDKYSSHHPYPT